MSEGTDARPVGNRIVGRSMTPTASRRAGHASDVVLP